MPTSKIRVADIALVLEHVALPLELAEQLRRLRVEFEMSDEQLAMLNDACIAYVQERGPTTDVSRRLESLVGVLNED